MLVTNDRDFWADRYRLQRSPGLLIVDRVDAASVVAAVSFVGRRAGLWSELKLWHYADGSIKVNIRDHDTGRIATTTYRWMGGRWQEVHPTR